MKDFNRRYYLFRFAITMKNKKAQTEILLFLLFIIGIIMFIGISIQNANPYNTFMKDCKEINKINFTSYDEVCYSYFDSDKETGYSCNLTNFNKLKEFCYNEWKNSQQIIGVTP